MGRITRRYESGARLILSDIIKKNFLISDTPKGQVKINFPASESAYFFPKLFPPETEMEKQKSRKTFPAFLL